MPRIEETGTAIGLIDELGYRCYGLVGVRLDRDKVARMASAKFEAGNVYLPESALWLADLEAELFALPIECAGRWPLSFAAKPISSVRVPTAPDASDILDLMRHDIFVLNEARSP